MRRTVARSSSEAAHPCGFLERAGSATRPNGHGQGALRARYARSRRSRANVSCDQLRYAFPFTGRRRAVWLLERHFHRSRAQLRGSAPRIGGGTLFLDEVADLPTAVQAKLLRALDSGEIFPLGESAEFRFDARIFAACQEPLATLVESGRLRDDLAARLNGVTVNLPDLHERKSDIPALFDRFLRLYSGGTAPPVSTRLYERPCLHWPGDVRESKPAFPTVGRRRDRFPNSGRSCATPFPDATRRRRSSAEGPSSR